MDGSNNFTCKRPVEADAFQSMRRSESPEVYPRLPKTRVGSSNKGNEWRSVPCGEWEGIFIAVNGIILGYTTTCSACDSDCSASLNPKISPVEINNGPTG